MAALCSRCGHYIFALLFLLSVYLLFSLPNLSCRRLDVYHTPTHGVALVRIYNAGLKCAARGSLEIQDPKNRHLGTIAPLYCAISSQLWHISTIGKKVMLNSNVSPTCPHIKVNFGPLAAKICRWVWDTPAHFNGFRILAALLHGTLVVASAKLRHWTKGATCIRKGGHHVGHWPTF